MLVPFRQIWCLSEPNIDGFFQSSLILQIGIFKTVLWFKIITQRKAGMELIIYTR